MGGTTTKVCATDGFRAKNTYLPVESLESTSVKDVILYRESVSSFKR